MNFPLTLQAYRPTKRLDIEVETKLVYSQLEADIFIKKYEGTKNKIKIIDENHLRDLDTNPTIIKATESPSKKAIKWDIVGIIGMALLIFGFIFQALSTVYVL